MESLQKLTQIVGAEAPTPLILTCGWGAAQTLAKWNNVGSALF